MEKNGLPALRLMVMGTEAGQDEELVRTRILRRKPPTAGGTDAKVAMAQMPRLQSWVALTGSRTPGRGACVGKGEEAGEAGTRVG